MERCIANTDKVCRRKGISVKGGHNEILKSSLGGTYGTFGYGCLIGNWVHVSGVWVRDAYFSKLLSYQCCLNPWSGKKFLGINCEMRHKLCKDGAPKNTSI